MLKASACLVFVAASLFFVNATTAANSDPVCRYVTEKIRTEKLFEAEPTLMKDSNPRFTLSAWRKAPVYILDNNGRKSKLSDDSMYVDLNDDGANELVVWVYEQAGPEYASEALAIVYNLNSNELTAPLAEKIPIQWISFREPIFRDAQGYLMGGRALKPMLMSFENKVYAIFQVVNISEMVVAEIQDFRTIKQVCYMHRNNIGGQRVGRNKA